MNIKFTINSFADLISEEKRKNDLIKIANQEFIKSSSMAIINLCRDIINNVIISKLNKLISQANDINFKNATSKKNNAVKELQQKENNYNLELESIRAILTSNLKQKKKVIDIIKASESIAEEQKFIVYYTTDFTEVLKDNDDILLAKKYIEIEENKKLLSSQYEKIESEYKQDIKNSKTDFVDFDFTKELSILCNVSNLKIYDLSELEPDKYYLLFGNDEDYNQYKLSLAKIQELYKKVKQLKIY